MSTRKTPQCRKCGQAMKGHNAMFCSVSPSPSPGPCKDEEEELSSQSSEPHYLSPPPSPPPPSSTAHSTSGAPSLNDTPIRVHRPLIRTYTPAIMSEASFEIPETGYFHRKNPRYQHLNTHTPIPQGRSLTPTEIVGSDGQPANPSVRSTSPTPTDSTSVAPTRPRGDVLQGLGLRFSVHKTPLGGRNAQGINLAAPVTPRKSEKYPYWNNGVAIIEGHWQPVQQQRKPSFVAAKMEAIGAFLESVNDFLNDQFIRVFHGIWGLLLFFLVSLSASLVGGYICKTYL